jgi:putative transposase
MINFAWQDGYAAFTASQSQLKDVQAYIRSQPEQHRTKTFVEEYRVFLERHRIEI